MRFSHRLDYGGIKYLRNIGKLLQFVQWDMTLNFAVLTSVKTNTRSYLSFTELALGLTVYCVTQKAVIFVVN
jgi:hypothetical protein